MADAPVVHIGENSPEQVAFRLMERIAAVEKVTFNPNGGSTYTVVSRNWILDTYAECLQTVRDANHLKPTQSH